MFGLTTAACLATFAARPLPAQDAGATTAARGLQPGDLLRITVWRKPEYSGEFMVTPEGTIAHPLYQTLPVAGVPLAAVKERLVELLSRYENNPLIVLEPLIRISVGGDVRQPNLYSVPTSLTVAQAIALAGGAVERGRLDRVRVVRGKQQIRLNLSSGSQNDVLMRVLSGDQIFVGHKGNFVRDVLTPLTSLTAAIVSIVVVVRQ